MYFPYVSNNCQDCDGVYNSCLVTICTYLQRTPYCICKLLEDQIPCQKFLVRATFCEIQSCVVVVVTDTFRYDYQIETPTMLYCSSIGRCCTHSRIHDGGLCVKQKVPCNANYHPKSLMRHKHDKELYIRI